MWHIKITLWQRIKHIFGIHVPIQWHDKSKTCLICKKTLCNPNIKTFKAGEHLCYGDLVTFKDGKVYKAKPETQKWITGSINLKEDL